MSVGGNKELEEYFVLFEFPEKSINYLYRTKAAAFYRKKLSHLASGQPFNDRQPTAEEAIEKD